MSRYSFHIGEGQTEQMEIDLTGVYKTKKGKDDVCLTWCVSQDSFLWLNRQVITATETFTLMKHSVKGGLGSCGLYDCIDKKFCIGEGRFKTLYSFTVKLSQLGIEVSGIKKDCPFTKLMTGRSMKALTFAFTSKINRDAVYRYVMRGIDQPKKIGYK